MAYTGDQDIRWVARHQSSTRHIRRNKLAHRPSSRRCDSRRPCKVPQERRAAENDGVIPNEHAEEEPEEVEDCPKGESACGLVGGGRGVRRLTSGFLRDVEGEGAETAGRVEGGGDVGLLWILASASDGKESSKRRKKRERTKAMNSTNTSYGLTPCSPMIPARTTLPSIVVVASRKMQPATGAVRRSRGR
jgi:hypothetical protein